MKNHFFSECRRRRRPFEAIEDHADSVASKPAQIAHAEYNELCAALEKLEPRQREVLIMIGASGLSYDEAAKISGCPTGTIKAGSIAPGRNSLNCCQSRARTISKKIASLPRLSRVETVQR